MATMTTEDKRVELLAFGYVNEAFHVTVSYDLIKLMQMFSDERYFYWTPETIRNPQNCEISFKIKGIEFRLKKMRSVKKYSLGIKYMPTNIDFVEFYAEMRYPRTRWINSVAKHRRVERKGGHLFTLSYNHDDLVNAETITVTCKINIQCIKYKWNRNKRDYYAPINNIHNYYKYTWNVNNGLKQNSTYVSQCFDNKNWRLRLDMTKDKKKPATQTLSLRCFCLPHIIDSMDVNFRFIVSGHKSSIYRYNISHQNIDPEPYGTVCLESTEGDKTWVDASRNKPTSIVVQLEIVNIYTQQKMIYTKHEMKKYGIIIGEGGTTLVSKADKEKRKAYEKAHWYSIFQLTLVFCSCFGVILGLICIQHYSQKFDTNRDCSINHICAF